ncbi:kynureninase [Mucilaginibacter daejeonensis]|uniref:kynureninase n=1 Tax=Mucilaginibacter daejeonensis TaxID=398049 RepID=UPI001D1721A4|nr:kynureninase [Mucilaginibacter daejeonensis]UEG51522.1 kynureninase [Mucilaginibacter daejeonensis]
MEYQNSAHFALELDAKDELNSFRERFLIPQHNGKDIIYLCGNSLGLQPKAAKQAITDQLDNWHQLAVEGWFDGEEPWLGYHKQLLGPLANIMGALPVEIAVMNSLTINLHLMMVSFYKPTQQRYKIIMEGGAFPSDQYAMESQVRFHGFDLEEAVIELFPREGEVTLRTEDILTAIEQNADKLALVMFSGINYYTGQFFDMEAITKAGHAAGAMVGFDLAHAAGNVPLKLHDIGADFACWCSYKYMNSGPGGISGIFVHEKHHQNRELNRFAGWWGYRNDTRFKMTPGFVPENGAEGWQVSTSPILLMAAHKASLELFEEAGSVAALRKKSIALTGYLEYLINGINAEQGEQIFKIITPKESSARGAQLSIICKRNGKAIFDHLLANGVLGDWREPDVIRLSAVPFYNSFTDVYEAAKHLAEAARLVK